MRHRTRKGPILLIVACTLGSLWGCGQEFDARGEQVPVPPELMGRWVTDHPRYQDRYFEVTDERLVFGTGQGTLTVHRIRAVFALESQGETLYQFRYRGGGSETYHFDVLYNPERRSIRFQNQLDVVWVPADEGASGARSPGGSVQGGVARVGRRGPAPAASARSSPG